MLRIVKPLLLPFMAAALFGATSAYALCAHSVCATGPALEPGCDTCVDSVCSVDSVCCSMSWDSICVSEVPANCGSCPSCGDGILESGETCDDGNVTPGDGCDASCQYEISAAVPTCSSGSLLSAGIGFGAYEYFSLSLPYPATVTLGTTDPGGSGCPGDSIVTLYTSQGEYVDYDDDSGLGYCSLLVSTLSAGDYVVAVQEFSNDTYPSYRLTYDIPCNPCGDGSLDSGEQCDDGNLASGDGCSASCQFEISDSLDNCSDARLSSGLAAGQTEYWYFELAAPGTVKLETTDSTGTGCPGDTVVWLYTADGAYVDNDDDSGINLCSMLVTSLPAGEYVVGVQEYDLEALPSFRIDYDNQDCVSSCGDGWRTADEQCDDGNLAPGDGCDASCEFEIASSAAMCGSYVSPGLAAGESEYVELTVPAGASLTLETTGPGGTGCTGDTIVQLLASDGTPLASDDDGGTGVCSLLTTPGLAAGTYVAKVSVYAGGSLGSYALQHYGDVCCGNSTVEHGEQCDGGACCAGDCTFAPAASACSDGNACTDDACNGAGACVGTNNTAPCDDGLFCTVSDACSGGVCSGAPRNCDDGNACTDDSCDETADSCVGTNNTAACDDGLFCTVGDTCSAGACGSGGPRNCADANLCTQDSCSETADTCVHAEEPLDANSCFSAPKAKLQITNSEQAGKDKLSWQWSSGEAFAQAILGNPTTSTAYALCLYDSTAGAPSLAASFDIAPSSTLWISKDPKGFQYKDSAGSSDGIKKGQIVAGDLGKTKVKVSAAGTNLVLPAPAGTNSFFHQQSQVVVQLVNGSGACWSSSFAAGDTTKNEAASFKAQKK